MEAIAVEPTHWSLSKKLAFRFFLIFFILYIFFNPNGVVPYIDNLYELYIGPFHNLVVWIGAHILHLAKPVTTFTNGSGDTTYDNIIILLITFLAVTGTLIWSVIDRKRRTYNKLFYWLTVVVRYYVAITMLSYGFFKVIKLQFPFPSFGSLMEPYGNSSPMGLAWNFMGYSKGYNYFTGIAELSCGLLFFRKTSALGAIIALVVTANIMAINYCFDVPVKLLSTALVLMSLFLLSRDFSRFTNFFILNKPAPAANISPHRFKVRWKNITLNSIKYLLIVYTIALDLNGALKAQSEFGDNAKKPPLYGLYDVKTFIVNKDTLKPLTTDTVRWSKLGISYPGNVLVKFINDTTSYYALKVDTVKKKIVMNKFSDTIHKYLFSYSEPKKDSLVMTGVFKKDSIKISLKRYDASRYLLVRRGFHWINEFPFNR
jgi:hypothetical protein